MRRRPVMAICAAVLGLGAPAAAAADGGPVPPMQGGQGASAPGGAETYVAVGTAGRTIVQRILRGTGAVDGYRVLRGAYGVPGVGFDGSTTGLSADGSTLVLAGMVRRYPPRSTPLAVLDTHPGMRLRRTFALPGQWTVDAVSPTGRWLYFIHYTSPRNALRYEVRAYDLERRRLVTKPVIDPREPDEKMQGMAVTRAVSADGRWAYTLYLRPGQAPFVHALDTAGRTAHCVDLPAQLTDIDLSSAQLDPSGAGGALRVFRNGTVAATIDTRTWKLRSEATPARRAAARAPSAAHRSDANGGGAWPWALTVVPLLGFAVVVLAERRRRRIRMASGEA
jgi:hypothetical protein